MRENSAAEGLQAALHLKTASAQLLVASLINVVTSCVPSASDDDDDDDEAAAAAGDAVAGDNVRLKGAVARHRAQLEALKARDPEFYAYLQQSDAELLGFGAGADDDEDADEDDADEDDEEDDGSEEEGLESDEEGDGKGKAAAAEKKTKKKAAKGAEEEGSSGDEEEEAAAEKEGRKAAVNVTSGMVEVWCARALEGASITAMRQLLKAYRVACHYGDSEAELDAGLRLSSGAAFNRLLLFVLREADGIFRRMLLPQDATAAAAAPAATANGVKKGGKGSKKAAKGAQEGQQQQQEQQQEQQKERRLDTTAEVLKSPRWKKVAVLVKSYLGNTLHLLTASAEAAMLAFVLRRLRASAPLLGPFAKIQRRTLRAALGVFGSADNAPRVQAILLVRAIALSCPPPALDSCLRGTYRAFAQNAKFVTAASLPHIHFMGAAVVEMTRLDA
ncbi:hypothetical protein MNEG_15957, partial [Monoraphidium neglectum]